MPPAGKIENGVDLVLYYYPNSFYSQKVVMALHQMNLKYQAKYVDTQRGRQFTEAFLSLNPKGEVPVLVDDVRVIPDAEKIINYLHDNFANGSPGLLPKDPEIRTRVEQFHNSVSSLKIEPLCYGAATFNDLGVDPKPPYNSLSNKSQMKDYLTQRPRTLQVAVNNYPKHASSLRENLVKFNEDAKLWNDRDEYEGLLIHFEKILDECEAELASHENPGWWLCSPEISVADIDLAPLLHRLWQLGFEKRMWERTRPNLKRYFARIQHLESFRLATTMVEKGDLMDILYSPVFLGILGTAAIMAGGYYLWSKKGNSLSSAFGGFFSDDPSPKFVPKGNSGVPQPARPAAPRIVRTNRFS